MGIDYAKQYLHEKGYKIFANGKQILRFTGKPIEVKELKTTLNLSKNLIEDKNKFEYFIKISYRQLNERFGYGILSEEAEDKWRSYQRKIWRLVKIRNNPNILPGNTISKYSPEFRFYPLIRAVRGICDNFVDEEKQRIGTGGDTGFIYIDRPEQEKKKGRNVMKDFFNRYIGREEKIEQERETLNIPEIPVMISEDNFLLTLDKKRDMQTILFIGSRGWGKSISTNALATRLKIKWEDKVAIIDPLGIFREISLPAKDFLKEISRVGEEPNHCPTIHLKMSCPGMEVDNDITFRLLTNFKDFLARYKFFTYGIEKYKLGAAEKYMSSLLKDNRIDKVKTADELKKILFEIIPGSDDKGIASMIFKWTNNFDGIFKEQFTDNLFDKEYSEWELQKDGMSLKSNPFIVSIYSNLLTVLNISNVKRQPTFRNRLADLIQQFIRFQEHNKKRTWICFDEMGDFYELKRKKRDNCSEAVEELFRQGRNFNIGIIGNSQPYSSLDDDIKKNTSILFCTLIRLDKERKEIKRDYDLDDEEMKRLGHLNRFEFMAMSKEPFVFYDTLGKRYVEKRIFVGKMVMPITRHSPPG